MTIDQLNKASEILRKINTIGKEIECWEREVKSPSGNPFGFETYPEMEIILVNSAKDCLRVLYEKKVSLEAELALI